MNGGYSRCVAPRPRRARGHIEQLRSGSYRAVVYVGIDPLTRKERYLKETANSYAQAKFALTRLQREVDEEAHPKTRSSARRPVRSGRASISPKRSSTPTAVASSAFSARSCTSGSSLPSPGRAAG